MAQLMPLPLTVSCFSKIQIGFTFLVPAHPGSPGQRAVKCVCIPHHQQLFIDPTKESLAMASLGSRGCCYMAEATWLVNVHDNNINAPF